MDAGLLAQYVMNGLMLGMMYALVAVGFTLFFGVLDIIKFSHGDVLTVGAFTALATYVGLRALGLSSTWLELARHARRSRSLAMALLGMLIARYLVMPLRSAPALNTLLITLMLGTVLRESVRLFYPQGANPKPFPALLPRSSIDLGEFNLRLDNVLMLAAGVLVIVGLQFLLNRTKLGLAIRAVAQDEETARTMGINFTAIVLITFAHRLGACRLRRRDERPLLQRDQFRHGPLSRRDRLFRRHHRRARQHLWRDPRRLSVRRRCRPSAPCCCRSPAPTRTCSPSPSSSPSWPGARPG